MTQRPTCPQQQPERRHPSLTATTAGNLGNGNDSVTVGNGLNDSVNLGNGNDVVTVGKGNDNISLGNGNDAVTAGNGNDNVYLDSGFDTVTVGDGNDNIGLGDGNDVRHLPAMATTATSTPLKRRQ